MNDNDNLERAAASLAALWLNPPFAVLLSFSSSLSTSFPSSHFSFYFSSSTSTPPPSPRLLPLLSVLNLAARENEVAYDVVAIVDPLTREAQKISSLLTVCNLT